MGIFRVLIIAVLLAASLAAGALPASAAGKAKARKEEHGYERERKEKIKNGERSGFIFDLLDEALLNLAHETLSVNSNQDIYDLIGLGVGASASAELLFTDDLHPWQLAAPIPGYKPESKEYERSKLKRGLKKIYDDFKHLKDGSWVEQQFRLKLGMGQSFSPTLNGGFFASVGVGNTNKVTLDMQSYCANFGAFMNMPVRSWLPRTVSRTLALPQGTSVKVTGDANLRVSGGGGYGWSMPWLNGELWGGVNSDVSFNVSGELSMAVLRGPDQKVRLTIERAKEKELRFSVKVGGGIDMTVLEFYDTIRKKDVDIDLGTSLKILRGNIARWSERRILFSYIFDLSNEKSRKAFETALRGDVSEVRQLLLEEGDGNQGVWIDREGRFGTDENVQEIKADLIFKTFRATHSRSKKFEQSLDKVNRTDVFTDMRETRAFRNIRREVSSKLVCTGPLCKPIEFQYDYSINRDIGYEDFERFIRFYSWADPEGFDLASVAIESMNEDRAHAKSMAETGLMITMLNGPFRKYRIGFELHLSEAGLRQAISRYSKYRLRLIAPLTNWFIQAHNENETVAEGAKAHMRYREGKMNEALEQIDLTANPRTLADDWIDLFTKRELAEESFMALYLLADEDERMGKFTLEKR